MFYVYVPSSYGECNHYVLQTSTIKKIKIEEKRKKCAPIATYLSSSGNANSFLPSKTGECMFLARGTYFHSLTGSQCTDLPEDRTTKLQVERGDGDTEHQRES